MSFFGIPMRNGLSLGLGTVASLTNGPGFLPDELFYGGTVQGAWYDPSDLTTLFQDSAGTTPVTAVEQAVGLMLDKSKGLVLGPELVTNGDFSQGATGWTVGTDWSISSGQASHVAGASLSNLFIATPLFVSGLTYQLTIDIVSISGGNLTVFCGDASSITFNTPGTKTMRLRAAGDLRLYIQAAAATVVTVDNISAKLLPGNHAYQTTSASRPTLRARYNLLTYSEQFDNAAWTKRGTATITPNDAIAPDGTLTADRLSGLNTFSNDMFNANYNTTSIGPAGVTYLPSIYIKRISTSGVFFIGNPSNSANGQWDVDLSLLPDTWVRITPSTPGVTVVNSFTTFAGGLAGIILRGISGGALSMHIWGAQQTLPAVFPSNTYQRIGAATDYATGAAFPPYLFFDGTDDSMLTNSVDFATVTSDGQARRNLLLNPTQFDAAGWTKNNVTVSADAAVAPDGTTTADKIIPTAANATHSTFNASVVTTTIGVVYTASVYVKAAEYNFVAVVNNTIAAYTASVCIDLTTGAQSNAGASGTYTATNVGNGWWRVTATATATSANGYLEVHPRATAGAANVAFAGDGTSGILAWGAQLETGSTATAFQNIGTDKMLVVAGVTKNSDANIQSAWGLGSSGGSAGCFEALYPPSAASPRFEAAYAGSAANWAQVVIGAAPILNVISTQLNSSARANAGGATIRSNGVTLSFAADLSNTTTGNFGNQALNIGRRNNASLPFNGNLYSLIIAGQSYSSGQISSTESWVAAKTPLGTI